MGILSLFKSVEFVSE